MIFFKWRNNQTARSCAAHLESVQLFFFVIELVYITQLNLQQHSVNASNTRTNRRDTLARSRSGRSQQPILQVHFYLKVFMLTFYYTFYHNIKCDAP